MQLERIESGPAWADKTSPEYCRSAEKVSEAQKYAREAVTGENADRTVEQWGEFIACLTAEQAQLFCIAISNKHNAHTRVAALNLLTQEFLVDDATVNAMKNLETDYLEAMQ